MTTAIKLLLNLHALSRKSIPFDQLQKALENLSQIVNERIAEDEQEKAPKKPRAIRPVKYKYKYKYFDEKTWTGQGRIPKILKIVVDNGANLDNFLIL
ncbi:H-NS family nucleoid-associated regulatory protein [Photobacterium phosphoreum]|uniref:H-NS family nucleoid-associated regulatory protein n=1 Tax=Photobacterium phosphoreum TaxID=659 RepID=UPI0007F8A8F6|nr:H-NS family nucleoid-associated regulatory protein [Photobacterium phosphoreum]OBU31003.1 hypothetical protein AYY24_20455 [Photobacterium phosphoreum]PSW32002.1 hypothetical protein CTM87_20770 [Photobacterium phosphoreum]